jgi:hypothetical protein
MALLSFCHYSSHLSETFKMKSIKKMTLANTCLSTKVALDFVLNYHYLKVHCLRATPSKPLYCLNIAKVVDLALTPT